MEVPGEQQNTGVLAASLRRGRRAEPAAPGRRGFADPAEQRGAQNLRPGGMRRILAIQLWVLQVILGRINVKYTDIEYANIMC